MPRFSSQFDQAVEKATSEMNTTEDYQTIFEICDKIQVTPDGPKQAIKAIIKRLNSNVPLHVMHALTLLDCCIKNCGKMFHLEVCSRDFESEIKKLLNKGHARCVEKLKEMLKRWTEEEFKNDPELSLIPSLYNSIKTENELSDNSHPQRHKDSLTREKVKKEEDDLAKAIELSLKESTHKAPSSTLYPNASASNPVTKTRTKETRKVRALYDFTAAEDNELSFKAGEIIHIIDDSDPSWILGSNQNGEGLFPANFVTSDLSETPIFGKVEKTVKFNDEVKVKTLETPSVCEEVVIDEKKIDALLAAFLDADPTGQVPDSDDLLALEDHCLAMGPLIEQQLEQIDNQHAALTQSNKLLVDALKSYETLMKSYPSVPYAPYQVPPEVMHTYPHPSAQPQVYSTHLQHHPGEPYQPMPVPTGHEHYQVPLSGALPTTLQSRNMQTAPPQVPYDTSNLSSYGTIPHHSIPATSSNYSVPLPSRDANGLYYGDLVANSMQHSTTPISMHQPML